MYSLASSFYSSPFFSSSLSSICWRVAAAQERKPCCQTCPFVDLSFAPPTSSHRAVGVWIGQSFAISDVVGSWLSVCGVKNGFAISYFITSENTAFVVALIVLRSLAADALATKALESSTPRSTAWLAATAFAVTMIASTLSSAVALATRLAAAASTTTAFRRRR